MTTSVEHSLGAEDTSRPGWSADRVGELAFSAFIVGIGVFAFVGAFAIRTPAGAQVGPRVFPFLVSAVLILSGIFLVIGVLRGRLGTGETGEDIDEDATTDWWTIAKIVALLVAVVFVLEPIGWWLTAALFFGGVAWTLGAKRWWMGFIAGLVIGIGTQLLFGEGLGLFLPRGYLFDAWYGPGPLFG